MEEQIETKEQPIGNIVIGYCDGCSKINAEMICTVYANPSARCRIGCAFSPIAKAKYLVATTEKKRVGQQKQAKKGKKQK